MTRNTRSAIDKWRSRTNPTPPASTVPAIWPAARTSPACINPPTRPATLLLAASTTRFTVPGATPLPRNRRPHAPHPALHPPCSSRSRHRGGPGVTVRPLDAVSGTTRPGTCSRPLVRAPDTCRSPTLTNAIEPSISLVLERARTAIGSAFRTPRRRFRSAAVRPAPRCRDPDRQHRRSAGGAVEQPARPAHGRPLHPIYTQRGAMGRHRATSNGRRNTLTCANRTQQHDVDGSDDPLKVAARVRIPYGLPTITSSRPSQEGLDPFRRSFATTGRTAQERARACTRLVLGLLSGPPPVCGTTQALGTPDHAVPLSADEPRSQEHTP